MEDNNNYHYPSSSYNVDPNQNVPHLYNLETNQYQETHQIKRHDVIPYPNFKTFDHPHLDPHHNPDAQHNQDSNSHLHSTSVGHSSTTEVRTYNTSTGPTLHYDIAKLAEHFSAFTPLDVYPHSGIHFHVEHYPMDVPPFRNSDKSPSARGLRYIKKPLPAGLFRLNDAGTKYVPVQPNIPTRLLVSLPDKTYLGIIDHSYVYHALYAIHFDKLEQVKKPAGTPYVEQMIDAEIAEFEDKRQFEAQPRRVALRQPQ